MVVNIKEEIANRLAEAEPEFQRLEQECIGTVEKQIKAIKEAIEEARQHG